MSRAVRLSRRRAAEVDRLCAAGVRTHAAAQLCAQAWVAQHSQPARLLPLEHGSERGYQQHRADGSPTCRACVDAHTDHFTTRRTA